MSEKSFTYEGRVAVRQEEGGHASPDIELVDLPDAVYEGFGKSLSEVLMSDLGLPETRFGDEVEEHHRMRISMEVVSSADHASGRPPGGTGRGCSERPRHVRR